MYFQHILLHLFDYVQLFMFMLQSENSWFFFSSGIYRLDEPPAISSETQVIKSGGEAHCRIVGMSQPQVFWSIA